MQVSPPRPVLKRSAAISRGCLLAIAIAALTLLHSALFPIAVGAKTPGQRHCYGKVCVKVLSIPEVSRLVGSPLSLTASHYDDPSVDPFNRGTFTSNGERFVADDPTRTASATFPDGTELLLRNPDNGHVSHVRVNDFGPFWVNRELDVTRRVATDMGFARQGIKKLEVTIIAAPLDDDVRRLYRRDRPPVPTMGHLGQRSREETATLANILMRRLETRSVTARLVSTTAPVALSPTLVRRETVYRVVPRQERSPRAAGAEHIDPIRAAQAAVVVNQWRAAALAHKQTVNFTIVIFAALVLIVLIGPQMQFAAGGLYNRLYRRSLAGWDADELRALAYGKTGGHAAPPARIDRGQRMFPLFDERPDTISHISSAARGTWVASADGQPNDASPSPGARVDLTFDEDYRWPADAERSQEISIGREEPTASIIDMPLPAAEGLPPHERLLARLQIIGETINGVDSGQDRQRGAA